MVEPKVPMTELQSRKGGFIWTMKIIGQHLSDQQVVELKKAIEDKLTEIAQHHG